ncbi:hypothetical protein THRCLA_02283 [Thraustotheca clavata]|uniref:Kinase n=1 Tax=Thraustotheca clavata TaxID=74557 RepID=A0A1W0A609_9STRA|nr:hypothetical protein THRCLA_02283 [Thraustotheca clavata]
MVVQLHLTVLEARGLARTQIFGTQDPYCILTLGHREERTEYHDNGGCEPFWNAPFIFNFRTPKDTAVIDIDIRNANAPFLPDNSIGFVCIKLDLQKWNDKDLRVEWLPVYRKQSHARDPNGKKQKGELKVRMEVLYDTTLANNPSVVVIKNQLKTPKSPAAQPPRSPSSQPPKSTSAQPLPSPSQRPNANLPQPSPVVRPMHYPSSPASNVSPMIPVSPSSQTTLDYRQFDGLIPYSGLWLPPQRWTIDKTNTINDLVLGSIDKEHILVQLSLDVNHVMHTLKAFSTLPKDHHMLRLKGFSAHEHSWCILYEHGVPLQHPQVWTRETMQIAGDTASAIAQLHLSQVIHTAIRYTMVYKDDAGRYRLHGFPANRAPSADTIDLPWAPPESLTSTTLTKKMDVYAFGIFLAELIVGTDAPYAQYKSDSRETFLQHVADGIYSLEQELVDKAPEPVLTLIRKCTNPNVSKRPASLTVVDLVHAVKADLFPTTHNTI